MNYLGFGLDDFWGDEPGITISESGAALDDVSGKGVDTCIAESVAEMDVSGEKVGISIFHQYADWMHPLLQKHDRRGKNGYKLPIHA